MNVNMTKWLILSLSRWIQTNLVNENVWIIGTERPKQQDNNRFEVRYTGPDITTQSRKSTKASITINCQIITVFEPGQIDLHLSRVGKAQKMLANCIQTYRIGSDSLTDTGVPYFPFQRDSDIMTTSLGIIDPVSKSERTTVEAAYHVDIDEE